MIVLVGPSACGKTALGKYLEGKGYKKVVTYTSRPLRYGETNGIDYNFLSKEDFETKIENNFFYEYICYQGNYYGTAKSSICDDCYLIVEPSGLKKYQQCKGVKSFFIECPFDVRLERMRQRHDNEEVIEKRLSSDDLIFNEEVKKSCDFILDGTKDFSTNYELIRRVINGL